MTFAEIIETLPNGLHDAMLSSVNVDYANRTIFLNLNIWIGDLESNDTEMHEVYKPATLSIYHFTNCIIEPPGYILDINGKEIRIDAGMFPHEKLKEPDQVFKNAAPNDEQFWIFLNELNSFIFVSAQKAELNWKEEGA